ncbi:hypothetical protein AJ79_06520 [Helicocarpus griseus UAMH5409]|uniref:Methyltransferase domain-containing protein n=1 Tax=Helicocarpus griseus UAMH5409 TaxID=1447875 RepID=A0A2B7XCC8_9EURO|nr:hypothetical protein AJ79_06520 [Helicocarpus griseus UAMH5409]
MPSDHTGTSPSNPFVFAAYIYPNDEDELDRQDMQYEMLKLVNHGRIYFAPLVNPRHILDIGTGSGIWPIEMATKFPGAEIIGTDLSPVQPTEVPENVHFYVDDATESDWLWPDNHFDYIHTSMLLGSVYSFAELIATAYKYLKPGGYIECHDYDIALRCDDGSLPPEDPDGKGPYAFQNWITLHMKSTSMMMDPPRPVRSAHQISTWMREAGYVDVQERITKVPVSDWPRDPHLKQVGMWNQTNWLSGLAGFSYYPFGERGLGWTKEQIEVFLVDVRKSLHDRSYHTYNNFHVVTARKPFPNDGPESSKRS